MQEITEVPLAQLHPHEKNPRIDAAQVEDLAESIRAHGIEVPLVVVPRRDGADGYTVIAGHRRMTAAITVGLTIVPVQIRLDLTNDETAQLTFMATENLMRDQLTVIEESRLVQELLDLGLSQAEIAKQTALGKKRVAERAKLSRLQTETGDKVHRGQITIDQALVIAEYADDPEAVEELERATGVGYGFDWATSRAKARRETQQAEKAAEKEIRKAGARLAADDSDFVALGDLLAEDRFTTPALDKAAADEVNGQEWDALVLAEHASCPGHCATATRAGVEWGCDQAEQQHPWDPTDAENEDHEEEEPSPLDRFTSEDLAAMAIYRARRIREALAEKDLEPMMRAELTETLVKRALNSESWQEALRDGTRALLGLDGDSNEAQARKAAAALPVLALQLIASGDRAQEQGALAAGTHAWQWRRSHPPTPLTKLMRDLDVEPSDLEKELRAAQGAPWDPPAEDETAEGAESVEVSA